MVWRLFSKGDGRKTMKAPGRRTDRIFRDEFEKDPATYFRDLRFNFGENNKRDDLEVYSFHLNIGGCVEEGLGINFSSAK
ncbi:hypothetical protein SAY87_025000 [Trapa incisa]|uniref:Uncharacterized protein n=1 Tax=Trapa incisa TaxID=236973 RepID=A0AAN7JFU9_9MYRT|nr:hypothetical protein SAY87_025000 [Trapa incisa]